MGHIWAEVSAEIYFEIRDVYAALELSNPFENCDYVFFVHQYKLFSKGWGGIAEIGLTGLPDSFAGFTTFRSFQPYGSNNYSDNTLRFIFQHEFGHLLGLANPAHAPEDTTTTLGSYAAMRAGVLWDAGYVPFNFDELPRLGWAEAPLLVQEAGPYSLKDLQAEDGRSIRVDLRSFGGNWSDEGFILSYHSGLGTAQAAYKSRGVAIWHVHDGPGTYNWDLEQASGRYNWGDPDNPVPDPVRGFDLMDYRQGIDNEDYFFKRYTGHHSDFFHVTTNSITEFSYRTNPSTFGGFNRTRLAPQTVGVSLAILMKRDENDEQNVIVDILAAPHETVIAPSGPLRIGAGSAVNFVLDKYFHQDECPSWMPDCNIIDSVAVWFNPHNDCQYSWARIIDAIPYVVPLGGNMVVTVGHEVFNPHHYTNTGRLRFEFGNSLTNFLGVSDYLGVITVEGHPVPQELLIAPAGGDRVAAGIAYPVKWTSNWSGDPRVDLVSVDFLISYDSGLTYTLIDSYTDADYEPDENGLNTLFWTPDLAQAPNDRVRIKLGCNWEYTDTTPLYNEAAVEADMLIYILDATFADATATGFQDYQQNPPFLGMPSGVVNIKVDADNKDAVIVGIAGGTGATEGKLLLNSSHANGLFFEDRTYQYLPFQMLAVGLGPIAVADYDQDGKDDFFACSPVGGPSRLYRQGATSFIDVSAAVFGGIDLGGIAQASWIDVNQDGTSALYLGRTSNYIGQLFATFLQYGNESFSELTGNGLNIDQGTTAVALADYSNAGDWGIAIGTSTGLAVYKAGETGEFIVQEIPGALPLHGVLSVHWADFNRDNLLDLLVLFEGSSVNSPPEAVVLYNNGGSMTWLDWDILPTQGRAVTRAIPVDYDLDGWIDVLLYSDDGGAPLLLANQRHLNGWASSWHDVADEVGLLLEGTEEHRIGALLVADFDGDGDLDLFVGRENATAGTLFRNEQLGGSNTPKNNWLGFDLKMEGNTMPFGATVSLLDAGQPVGAKVVDGGGGVHQLPQRLIFGLGDAAGPFDVQIRWPDRRESNIQVFGTNQVISASLGFKIIEATYSSHIEYDPGEDTYDWVFIWETDYWTEPGKDRIEIKLLLGELCEVNGDDTLVLQSDGTGAVESMVLSDVSKGTYVHELLTVA